MEDYADKVEPPHQDNVYQYCRASYLAETGRASQAIALLRMVVFTDVYYETSGRLLLTKILYQKEELDDLLYQINSFSRFLQRNKDISAVQRRTQFNFLKFLRQLARLRARLKYLSPEEAEDRLSQLVAEIQAQEVAESRWLTQQIQVLRPKPK
jgi:hypothetical protein